MPNAFGFTRPGQQPTSDPRAVGRQLMQSARGPQPFGQQPMGGGPQPFGQQPMGGGPQPVGQQPMQPMGDPQQQFGQQPMQQPQPFDVDPVDAEFPAHSMGAALRREGGKLMGGGGSDDGALSAAVGEALTRAGGGHKSNPNPFKNRDAHVQHLQQLGISQLEAELLREVL